MGSKGNGRRIDKIGQVDVGWVEYASVVPVSIDWGLLKLYDSFQPIFLQMGRNISWWMKLSSSGFIRVNTTRHAVRSAVERSQCYFGCET